MSSGIREVHSTRSLCLDTSTKIRCRQGDPSGPPRMPAHLPICLASVGPAHLSTVTLAEALDLCPFMCPFGPYFGPLRSSRVRHRRRQERQIVRSTNELDVFLP